MLKQPSVTTAPHSFFFHTPAYCSKSLLICGRSSRLIKPCKIKSLKLVVVLRPTTTNVSCASYGKCLARHSAVDRDGFRFLRVVTARHSTPIFIWLFSGKMKAERWADITSSSMGQT